MKEETIDDLLVVAETDTDEAREARRYEIGYLLVPTIATASVADTVSTLIRDAIAQAGGQIIAGDEPKLISLMYPIRKTIDNKNLRFKEAYFASLRFTVAPDQITLLDQAWRFSPAVLRFLIIELPALVEEPHRRPREESISPIPPVAPAETMSQVEMDREIDSLLATAS
ncbi:MAG: 30S ribosomal protein S6 [Candidatus Vogelbacteria bacterium]